MAHHHIFRFFGKKCQSLVTSAPTLLNNPWRRQTVPNSSLSRSGFLFHSSGNGNAQAFQALDQLSKKYGGNGLEFWENLSKQKKQE
jgi:hypothetical protein